MSLHPTHRLLLVAAVLIVKATAPVPALRAQDAFDGRRGEMRVTAPRIEAGVTIDGRLEEPEWQRAARLTGFSQFSPADDRPADDSTEVLVWYSPTALYFGIRAHEAHGAVHATLADRDHISADDFVEILIGTFNNGRQATFFAVNPLGVQADGVVNEVGAAGGGAFSSATVARESPDLAPDLVFESRGRVVDAGYEVEVRIPFKSLRYQSESVQTWGLNVVRHVQHSGYEDTWAPARRSAPSFLTQSGELVDLTDLRRGIVLDLNPELPFRVAGAPGGVAGEDWSYNADRPDVGGNVRWGVTNDLTLNGTVQPDFSQVEADVAQFAFDPRQALSFPEKRPFFLDGIEQFDAPNRLIYTRRVVQPLGAVKLTGKLAGTDVAFLSAVDDPPGLDDQPVFNVLRAQRAVGSGSRMGIVITDRRQDGLTNTVAGTDGRFVFGAYALRLQVARSWTDVAGSHTAAPLWEAGLTRGGREFGFRMQARGIHEDFRALSGFISRPGIANALIAPRYTIYGSPGRFVESLTGEVRVDGTWRYRDFVRGDEAQDKKLHLNVNAAARGGWKAGGSLLVETFGYDPDLYSDYAIELPRADGTGAVDTVPFVGTPDIANLDWVVSLTTPAYRHFSGNLFALWGHDENFFEWASGDIWLVTIGADWRPTERLRVGLLYQHQQVNRRTDGSRVDLGRIPRLKLEYQVTRAIFVRLVGQYNAHETDALRDDSRTNAPILIRDPSSGEYVRTVPVASNELQADALFAYRPTPGTTVFVGYGSTATEPFGLRFDDLERQEDRFFVKLSYLYRM